jgi:hypothetical protein
MRVRYSRILTLSMFGVLATGVAVQAVPYSPNGGMPVRCSDAAGAPVYGVVYPARDVNARSAMRPNGARMSAFNFERPGMYFPSFRLFVDAHECGREISAGILNRLYLDGIDFNVRNTADRNGLRLMQGRLSTSAADVDSTSLLLLNNPLLPMYLHDLHGARSIPDCYSTHNDACTPKNDAVFASGPAASSNRPERGGSGQPSSEKLTFSDGLTQLVSAAQSRFAFVTYKCDFVELGCVSIKFEYKGKIKSCVLAFQGGAISYCSVSLASEKDGTRAREDFDQAAKDVAQVLNGWSRKDDNLTGEGKPHLILLDADFTKDWDAKKSQQVNVRLERRGLGNFVVSLIVNAPRVIY